MTSEEPANNSAGSPAPRDKGMPQRKPPGMAFETFVERQIRQSIERGEFDNLPGAGKPLPRRDGGEDWWINQLIEREGLTGHELLPPALRLRRERELLPEKARSCRTEAEVRELAAGYNRDVAEEVRRGVGDGPNIPLRRIDPDILVSTWRDSRHP